MSSTVGDLEFDMASVLHCGLPNDASSPSQFTFPGQAAELQLQQTTCGRAKWYQDMILIDSGNMPFST